MSTQGSRCVRMIMCRLIPTNNKSTPTKDPPPCRQTNPLHLTNWTTGRVNLLYFDRLQFSTSVTRRHRWSLFFFSLVSFSCCSHDDGNSGCQIQVNESTISDILSSRYIFILFFVLLFCLFQLYVLWAFMYLHIFPCMLSQIFLTYKLTVTFPGSN